MCSDAAFTAQVTNLHDGSKFNQFGKNPLTSTPKTTCHTEFPTIGDGGVTKYSNSLCLVHLLRDEE
jgi:hypothetical protein